MINQNPFCVLGISPTATEREIQKQVTKTTRYAEVGKQISFDTDFSFTEGLKRDKVTVLQCTTDYPAPMADINLRAMETIKNKLGVKVGYSDHTQGWEVAIAAAASGAEVIEKHFTLDRNMIGPDHAASLEPDELFKMIVQIRNVELAMGSAYKRPSIKELSNSKLIRKSIFAKTKIHIGEKFSSDNLTTKRPGSGISPMKWDSLIGQNSIKNYDKDEQICVNELVKS